MSKSKVLIGIVVLCYVLFVVFEFSGYVNTAYYFHSLIAPLITLIYILFVRKKSRLFLLFLLCYSVSDLLGLVLDVLPIIKTQKLYNFEYYFGNLLYMFSYMFLIVKICKSINIGLLLRHFKIHTIALTALGFYFVYVLQEIISSGLVVEGDYYFELIYNITTVLLLPLSLLNYFYRDNKKALYLFLGSLCIVFSEVMDVAHIYVKEMYVLNFLSTTLALIAFYFYYQQSKFSNVANRHKHFRPV